MASANVAGVDVLGNWNFRHMVNWRRIRRYTACSLARWSEGWENSVVWDDQDPMDVGATGRSPVCVNPQQIHIVSDSAIHRG